VLQSSASSSPPQPQSLFNVLYNSCFYGQFILSCLTEGATYPVAPRSRPYCSMQMMQNLIYLLNTVREWHWLLTVTEFISVTALQCSTYVGHFSKRLLHQNQA